MNKPTHEQNNLPSGNSSDAIARIDRARKTGAPVLDLSNLGLTELPEAVGQLTRLQMLFVNQNRLSVLPDAVGELTQLQTLNLSGNQLATLPEVIGRLTQLKELWFENSRLAELPEAIGQLTQLQTLNLSDNRLATLPEIIGRLTQLRKLWLKNNQLTALPEAIGHLTRLEHLDLSDNQLTALPESLRKLRSLEGLYLYNNDNLGLPVEVIGEAWENTSSKNSHQAKPTEILEYYFRVRGGGRPLNEAKLIFVGRGGVGKTSMVNRLVHGRFDKDEIKTEGINITEWKIRLNGNEEVRLNIWDFGGQEIMHATHQFFLTQRSLYLLVLNGRKGGEDADAEYWLKLIDSFGGDSPVILVLNKMKEHPFDLNRRGLQQKYPIIRDFIKTDCADGTGIPELYKAIERESDRLEHLRDAFPASWFSIKDRLAGMKKNFLDFDQYCALCDRLGERDQISQEALAGYLHNLGIVLNYRQDPRLQDTHVLNPHWVTNGIYRILNAKKLEQQQGEIRLSDVPEILAADEYPANMRRFIFDLMKKFELCFSFPDDEFHYLIPELLDKQEPVEAGDFMPATCLNFQYYYLVLPEGLLPRFIVRTHVLSEGLPRWRTGVILQFEGNRALVKADVLEKKVFISVNGPVAGQRRLLAIIRSDFERIHRDIRNLQPQEMVPLPVHYQVVMSYQELLVMERNGMTNLSKVVGSSVVTLNVHELLNGVDLEGTRRRKSEHEEQRQALRLFCSYSHRDESLRNELETHLKLLQRQGLIDTWHDRKIEAGDDWKHKIDENLERADIILLLISADFIASQYCYEIEMNRALQRHESGDALVIPVILRDCNWQIAPFAQLQTLPKEGKAVKKWPSKDSAWRDVAQGIERVIKEIQKKSIR